MGLGKFHYSYDMGFQYPYCLKSCTKETNVKQVLKKIRKLNMDQHRGGTVQAVLATERDKKGTKFGDQGTHEYFF